MQKAEKFSCCFGFPCVVSGISMLSLDTSSACSRVGGMGEGVCNALLPRNGRNGQCGSDWSLLYISAFRKRLRPTWSIRAPACTMLHVKAWAVGSSRRWRAQKKLVGCVCFGFYIS